MTTVSTSFTEAGVSAALRLQAIGEDVTIALSGTYVATVQLERALTPDEQAWEAVYPPNRGTSWSTANATVSDIYKTQSKNEKLRLRCTAFTSGTVVTTIADGDLVIAELKDTFGNVLRTNTQAGEAVAGTSGITGNQTFSSTVDVTGELSVATVTTDANLGTSAATSVKEYGDGFNHITVLTATALAVPAITEGAAEATGDLIYTFPAGAIILDAAYMSIALNLNGTDQDAIVADLGLGTTIGTGAVGLLDTTAGFEDILSGQPVTCNGVSAIVAAKQSTGGGPMFIATGDDHTVHVNYANSAWAAQSDGDGTGAYTGTVILIWKFLE